MHALLAPLLVSSLATAAVGSDLSSEMKDLNWVGFQQFQEVSRVFVRTTEPVRYSVNSQDGQVVELVLQNTRVAQANLLLPLDTQYFKSPVRYIEVKATEAPSPLVRVLIYLRQMVPFKEQQQDNQLALDFVRPQE